MKLVRCIKCGELKTSSLFVKDKTIISGYKLLCKNCDRLRAKKYRQTKRGLISQIYNHQKQNSKRRGYNNPNYTKNQLMEWIICQPLFFELFETWEQCNYHKELTPSVDRKDDYKSYTIDNIQLMTWGQNRKKSYKDVKYGINNKKSKTTLQLDMNGNFIKEYYSLKEASRSTGIQFSNISACCLGKKGHSHAGGFKWKYKLIA